MRAVHDKIEGPFAIEEDIALYGMVAMRHCIGACG